MDKYVTDYIIKEFRNFTDKEIEDGVCLYCLSHFKKSIQEYIYPEALYVSDLLEKFQIPVSPESIIRLFGILVDDNNKNQNGIVFTPEYISEYISENILSDISEWRSDISIIDPGCGCGIFLISAIKYLNKKFSVSVADVIENNIYGIDIDPVNARRCELVLMLFSVISDRKPERINISCADSLKNNWYDIFNLKKIDYILGNPPYVNPYDMSSQTLNFLKNNFSTACEGTFNIFYAFIESAASYLSNNGKLGFIVPNNFLTIKSASLLREYLKTKNLIDTIIDFGENMVFKPVRTYNCIIFLDKYKKEKLKYAIIPKNRNIKSALYSAVMKNLNIEQLQKSGWKLIDDTIRKNIDIIESFSFSLGGYIRTGIATLKDSVYFINFDENGFFVNIEDEKIYIEDEIIKPIYKIPELRSCSRLIGSERFLIFPYKKEYKTYSLIPEKELLSKYPNTYKYLIYCRSKLESRDKGRKNRYGWYAYGRVHGINRYGKKLLFSAFSDFPRFRYDDNTEALFCNGYAIFENEFIDLKILGKILNSAIMKYYIGNTSYMIEGGYYCYQKKYLERFSVPDLSEADEKYISEHEGEELDKFLFKLYGLEL